MAIAKEYRPSPSSPKALDKTMKNASVARSPRILPPERLQKLRRICCALIVNAVTLLVIFCLPKGAEKLAFIFVVPKTGTIDRVSFSLGTVTTDDSLDIGLETVDATTGAPTGSAYGSSAVATQASVASNTAYEMTLIMKTPSPGSINPSAGRRILIICGSNPNC